MGNKFLFFDLDGTLTDPGVGITNSVAYAIEKMGLTPPAREDLYCYIGPPLIEMFMEKCGFSLEDARRALAFYRVYFTGNNDFGKCGMFENELYDKIPWLLSELKKNDCKIVLATSKPEPFAEKILEHFGILQYFDLVCGSTLDETRTSKSQVIEYAINSLNLTAFDLDSVLMIGDRHNDIEGAHCFGIKAVGVLYGYGSREELEACGADFIAEDIETLYKIILENV